MKKSYLIANWKLYLSVQQSVAMARTLAELNIFSAELTVCPSTLALPAVARILRRSSVRLGSQTIAPFGQRAATGETAGSDLKMLGCSSVLIGHSERRALGETDGTIRSKLQAALQTHLVPVLCVGEQEKMRLVAAQAFVRVQLRQALRGWKGKKIFLTYEPVWAISRAGKGTACPPERAFAMGAFVCNESKRLAPNSQLIMLYGGNVQGSNITDYVDGKTFHGALVGHASTKIGDLKTMLRAIGTAK